MDKDQIEKIIREGVVEDKKLLRDTLYKNNDPMVGFWYVKNVIETIEKEASMMQRLDKPCEEIYEKISDNLQLLNALYSSLRKIDFRLESDKDAVIKSLEEGILKLVRLRQKYMPKEKKEDKKQEEHNNPGIKNPAKALSGKYRYSRLAASMAVGLAAAMGGKGKSSSPNAGQTSPGTLGTGVVPSTPPPKKNDYFLDVDDVLDTYKKAVKDLKEELENKYKSIDNSKSLDDYVDPDPDNEKGDGKQ